MTAEDIAGLDIRKGHQRLILAGIAREQGVTKPVAAVVDADDTAAPAAEAAEARAAPQSAATAAVLSPALFDGMSSPVDAVCSTFEALVSELRTCLAHRGAAADVLGRLQTAEDQITTTLFGKLQSQDLDDDDCAELMEFAQALAHRDFDSAIEAFKQLTEREEPDDIERGVWIAGISALVDLFPSTLCSGVAKAAEAAEEAEEEPPAGEQGVTDNGIESAAATESAAEARISPQDAPVEADTTNDELHATRDRIEQMSFDAGEPEIEGF